MAISIFITVFCSSMVGAKLFGLSLNKLAILYLEIILLFNYKKNILKINKVQKKLLFWYVASAISSVSGIIFQSKYNIQGFNEIINLNMNDLITVFFIYIPFALVLWNSGKINKFNEMFLNSFRYTVKIHSVYAIIQFILYYTLKTDINKFIFEEMFGGMIGGGSSWTSFHNMAGSGILLRVTGLNHDAAFFGMLLVLGFVIEKSNLWKIIYLFCASISFSRSAIITMLLVFCYYIMIRKKDKIRINSIMQGLFLIIVITVGFFFLYKNSFYVQEQIQRLIARFLTIKSGNDGTSRHIGYPVAAFIVLALDTPFIQKLFGVGVDCGGALFTCFKDNIQWLDLRWGGVWAVESDFANVLLGTGIVGFIVYYLFLLMVFFKHKNNQINKILAFAMVVFGLMYNMAGITFIQLIYISILAVNKENVWKEGN